MRRLHSALGADGRPKALAQYLLLRCAIEVFLSETSSSSVSSTSGTSSSRDEQLKCEQHQRGEQLERKDISFAVLVERSTTTTDLKIHDVF